MQRHLDDLYRTLTTRNLRIDESAGNGLDISAVWTLRHPAAPAAVRLIFEGMGELSALPIEQSYGFHVKNAPHLSLYFSKNNPMQWRHDLAAFADALEQTVFRNGIPAQAGTASGSTKAV